MKSNASAVRVALEIDSTRYDFLSALAKVRGLSVAALISLFLTSGLNHPLVASSHTEALFCPKG